MSHDVVLRSANIKDALLLLEWRNDPKTRKCSHNTDEIQSDEHINWLMRTLINPYRKLLIAEEDGHPVGSVRADYADGVWELSWTVAPKARGRGVAKRMVMLLARQIPEPIRAEVKSGNDASARIAEYVGMKLNREIHGVLHYHRGNFTAQILIKD